MKLTQIYFTIRENLIFNNWKKLFISKASVEKILAMSI